jgi:hypothetical protein
MAKNFLKSILLYSIFFATSSFASEISSKDFKDDKPLAFVANGFVNFTAASRTQDSNFRNKTLPDGSANRFTQDQAIGNDSQIYLKTGFKTNQETTYGAVAKLEYNINSDIKKTEKLNLDQAYVFQESKIGKIEFGNNKAVNQKMKVGPARFARGAGGINGKYLENVNLSDFSNNGNVCSGASCSNIKSPQFILLAQSPIGHGGYAQGNISQNGKNQFNQSRFRALKDDSFDGMEDATKISYYTPRIAGIQLGMSYAPNSLDQGVTANTTFNNNNFLIKDIFSFGLNYSDSFDNLGVTASATAEKGKANNSYSLDHIARNDLFAYDFGTSLSYFGFTIGASYGSWGKSLQEKSGIYSCNYNSSLTLSSQNCVNGGKKFSNPYYYTTGIAYEFGPLSASVTSIKSVFQKNKYDAISFGIDYKYKKDLMPYFEITRFKLTSNQPSASDIANQSSLTNNQRQLKDNSGFVFLTGILLSF